MVDKTNPDNFEEISYGLYVVRTQAGFVQALRSYLGRPYGSSEWYHGCTKDETISNVRGYPTAYPSIIAVSWGYNGSTHLQVNAAHLNRVKEVIDKH